MGVFDEIGVFFGKTIPNVVTKEIPKFVTKTIPSVFQRDTYAPDLPPLRKEVAALGTQVETARDAFFTAQGKLRASLDRYRTLSEDFQRSAADSALDLTVDTKGAEKMSEELHGAEKTLNDIGQTTRMVGSIVTLGILDLGLMGVDNANERAQLTKSKKALTALLKRYQGAIAKIATQQATVEQGIAEVEAALRKIGTDGSVTPSELTEFEVADQAKRDMAAKLLADGMLLEGVVVITGLPRDVVASLEPDHSDPLPEESGAITLTDDEKSLMSA